MSTVRFIRIYIFLMVIGILNVRRGSCNQRVFERCNGRPERDGQFELHHRADVDHHKIRLDGTRTTTNSSLNQ